ncbi:MAG: HIT domain-containing protein, partial [Thiotrichaceae bacterium]|nr:HIT domain-containing protein [Thiotrichaceae bacterium]
GLLIGWWLFSDSRPRQLITFHRRSHASSREELLGLLASVGVQKLTRLIPGIILETDKTIVFKHPKPKYNIHYIFAPKKDIKDIGDFSEDDKEYLNDLFATLSTVIHQENIQDYVLWSNGPGKQDVTYLHFHLGAK